MKKLLLLIFPLISYAQDATMAYGGNYEFNPDNIPCITAEDKVKIWENLNQSIEGLKKEGLLTKNNSKRIQSLSWPVRNAASSDFFDVWAISNYVDHNTTFPNNLTDYNCGDRTYDTNSGYNHQGLDIYSWPFTWYQFQNNMTEVIAAAPGTIIFKSDGNFDMSCSFNNNPWNAIYVQHSDGSIAWYGHLKSGSLLNKGVGSTVATGEYLGVVGSSGNSTGPHLHFEVYDENNVLLDPYRGPCNNVSSSWLDQKDYYEPNINALLTHNSAPNFQSCPSTELVNLSDQFDPNQEVYLASYFRDQQAGTTASYTLYSPNGNVFFSWTRNFTNTFTSSYWYWTFNNLSEEGSWRFECSYLGQTEAKTFNVGTALSIDEAELAKLTLGPNPFDESIRINANADTQDLVIRIYNKLGQEVFRQNKFSAELNLSFLSQGVYYLKISDQVSHATKIFPLIKK